MDVTTYRKSVTPCPKTHSNPGWFSPAACDLHCSGCGDPVNILTGSTAYRLEGKVREEKQQKKYKRKDGSRSIPGR